MINQVSSFTRPVKHDACHGPQPDLQRAASLLSLGTGQPNIRNCWRLTQSGYRLTIASYRS